MLCDRATIGLAVPVKRADLVRVGVEELFERSVGRGVRVIAKDEISETQPPANARGEEPGTGRRTTFRIWEAEGDP